MRVSKLTAGAAGNIHAKAPVGTVISETGEGAVAGFGVLVGKTARHFIVRFRVKGGDGTQFTKRLGRADGKGAMTLAKARDEARAVKLMARGSLGQEPRHPDQDARDRKAKAKADAEAAQMAKAEAVKAAGETFGAVAQQYLNDGRQGGGLNLRSRREVAAKVARDLQPWADIPITEITQTEVDRLVGVVHARGPVAANRLLGVIKVIFAWAMKRGLVKTSPATYVDNPHKETPRERFLDGDEIEVFWTACGRLPEPAGRIYRLLLVLGQRRAEVGGLRHSELSTVTLKSRDLATGVETAIEQRCWRLPARRSKNGKAHLVPLSTLACRLIDEAPVMRDAEGQRFDHVFSSGTVGDVAASSWSRWRRALDVEVAAVLAERAGEAPDPERHRFAEPWHVHDLRASCATLMEADLGVAEHVVSRVLNHTAGGAKASVTRSRYLRSSYDLEASQALQAWADHLGRLVGLNVVPFAERAS
jgi:integrase